MKRVLIILSDRVEAFEAAAFTDVLGWADTFGTRLKTDFDNARLKSRFFRHGLAAWRLHTVIFNRSPVVFAPRRVWFACAMARRSTLPSHLKLCSAGTRERTGGAKMCQRLA